MNKLTPIMICTLLLSACGVSSPEGVKDLANDSVSAALSCVAESPFLFYGEGLDGSSANTVPLPASTSAVKSFPECEGSQAFHLGMGKADITGYAAGAPVQGPESPTIYTAGIHTRLYARSMIAISPCNGKRVALVVSDLGLFHESVRQTVLAQIEADPDLTGLYTAENLMMNATHTHSGPGGQAHYAAYNTLRAGHEPKALEVLVAGIMASLKEAHLALSQNAQPSSVLLSQGELLNTNKSRAIPAYMNNPESERSQFLDDAGNPITTTKLMSLLKLQDRNEFPLGSFNWFGVHPTSDFVTSDYVGEQPISGDNKGFAALFMERMFSETNPDFVSAFSQADEGDSFSDLWFDNPEERARQTALLPSNEPRPATIANAQKHLLKATELFNEASEKLSGPIDYRFIFVEMDQVEITDQVILDSLNHPAELDVNPKRTCGGALGVSFTAGGGGAPPDGTTQSGVTCSDPDAAQAAADDFQALSAGSVPSNMFASTVGCNAGQAPGANLDCHAEKPILLIVGEPTNGEPNIIPMQLFRIGNLAIIGLPWEVTTMAGRRLRQTVLDELKHDGVDYVVINGLSNGYMHYLTTREEYAIQQYEGGSNVFGPWSLAAVQQTFRGLALDMVNGETNPSGEPAPLPPPFPQNPNSHNSDATPPGSEFGDVVVAPNASYQPGDTVRVVFQASSPNSDFKTESSFLFIEKQVDDLWEIVALDADPETSFVWHSDTPEPQVNSPTTSTAEILWRLPRNTAPSVFRIRFEGVANQGGTLTPYQGQTESFSIDGPVADCP